MLRLIFVNQKWDFSGLSPTRCRHVVSIFSNDRVCCNLLIRSRDSPYGPQREQTCLQKFANNRGADQPAHPCRLISALVIRFWERIISKLATGEISIF